MPLSTFIRAQHEQIVGAFEAFARTLMPAGVNMVPLELRDHAEEMLTAVATDTEGPQTRDEQSNKSKGPAHPHAVLRFDAVGDLAGAWDADRLAQVVTNLLGNAVQHGEGGTVTLEANGVGDPVLISVHNAGAPIPPDLRHAIFEPLVRRQPGHDNGSIGLGLFIARAMVTSHGGEIDVTSTAEKGTRFTARIPRTVRPAVRPDER